MTDRLALQRPMMGCRWRQGLLPALRDCPQGAAARLASVAMEGNKMGRDEAFATFQGCVAEVLDIDPVQVTPNARWAEEHESTK